MKILKKIFNWLMFVLGAKNELAISAVEEGICDFSGQGRNVFGK